MFVYSSEQQRSAINHRHTGTRTTITGSNKPQTETDTHAMRNVCLIKHSFLDEPSCVLCVAACFQVRDVLQMDCSTALRRFL